MNELQSVSMDLLKEFVRLCEALHLRYFAVGGTCLGAVRHGGFIPWDDDIDVGMPRRDYEIFIKEAPAICKEYYYIQNFKREEEPDLIYIFTKMRDSRTAFIEKGCRDKSFNQGIFLDIFPLDGENRDPGFWFRSKILGYKIAGDTLKNGRPIHKLIRLFLKFYPISLEKARRKLDKMFSKYDYETSEKVANYCGAWAKKEIMKREWIEPVKTLAFEDITVSVPGNYDAYLKRMYGNYMQLPPEEKRQSHHDCEIVDAEKSFTEYKKEKQQ